MAALCLIKQSLPVALYFYFYASAGALSEFYLRVIMGAGDAFTASQRCVIYVITSMRRRCAKTRKPKAEKRKQEEPGPVKSQ